MRRKNNLKELKDRNKKLILKTLINKGALSRTEISQYTGLSLTAVSDLVDELIEENIVKENGIGTSTGGRRPIMLQFNPESGYILVVKVDKNKIVASLFDFSMNKISQKEIKFDYFEISKLEAKIKECYFSFEKETCKEGKKIFGIGICLNNDVKTLKPKGILNTSISSEFITIEQSLSLELGLTVVEEDELNLKAMVEYQNLNTSENLAYIKIDEDIESSVIIKGKRLETSINIGQMIVDKNGPTLEAVVSIKSIIKRALIMMIEEHEKEQIDNIPPINIDNLCEILNDEKKNRLINEVSNYLKVAIINLKNLLDIKVFIFDGKILKLSALINSLARSCENLVIKNPSTKDEDVMREAAKLTLRKIINIQEA